MINAVHTGIAPMLLSPAHDPELIAGFYTAAAQSGHWNGPWSAVCTAFQAEHGLLYRQSRASERTDVLATRNWPVAPGLPKSSWHPNVAGDRPRLSAAPVHATPDPAARERASDRHVLCATIALDDTAFLGMGLHRQEEAPRFTDADRHALDSLGQHVASALRLETMLSAERSASVIRGAALDQCSQGMMIATASGRLLFANRAARTIAHAGSFTLGHESTCLGGLEPTEANRLGRLLASVANGGPGGCVRITRHAPMLMFAAVVEPLASAAAHGVANDAGLSAACLEYSKQPLVLITLRDLAATADAEPSHLMDLFGLTAAEIGILPQLVSGESVSLIAQSRGVAPSTVKAQTSKVLAKTGAQNLRALATMIAALG